MASGQSRSGLQLAIAKRVSNQFAKQCCLRGPLGRVGRAFTLSAGSRLGRTSFAFELAVFRGEELLVHGSLVYVNASLESRKPQLLPEPFVRKVMGFEKFPPEHG